jgi:hypothetical protein
MNVPGVDVSNWQKSPDWVRVAAFGIRYAWVLATDGSGFMDKYYEDDVAHARNNGLKVGGYHYARPDTNDALKEARWYRSHVPTELDLPTALDMETNWLPSITANTDWALWFFDLVKTDPPLLYTNGDGATKHLDAARLVAAGVELWYANPGANDLTGVADWPRASALQYGTGVVPGISHPLPDGSQSVVDLDIMPEEVLTRWTSGGPSTQQEDENVLHIIKGDKAPEWWLTDMLLKRYIPSAADAAVIVMQTVRSGGRISHDGMNGPQVLPQASVDAIPLDAAAHMRS